MTAAPTPVSALLKPFDAIEDLDNVGSTTLEMFTSGSFSIMPIKPGKQVKACPCRGFVRPSVPSSKPEQCDTNQGSSGLWITSRSLADRSLKCRARHAPVSAVSWLMPDLLSACMCILHSPIPKNFKKSTSGLANLKCFVVSQELCFGCTLSDEGLPC